MKCEVPMEPVPELDPESQPIHPFEGELLSMRSKRKERKKRGATLSLEPEKPIGEY
jgi:hypothetical protein